MLEENKEQFKDYYENHEMVTSLNVYLPLVKMDLMMDYICNEPLGKLEKFICKCIKQGITERYGIMDALALEDEVVNDVIEELIKNKIIKEVSGKLVFVDEQKDLEEIKVECHKKGAVCWCYKGLMNADKKIDTHLKAFDKAINIEALLQKKAYYLLPNVLLEVKPEELKAIHSKMLHYPKNVKEEVTEMLNLEIIKLRTVLYEAYTVIFFKGAEGDVKVLVHGIGENPKVEEAFTKTLQRLYDRSEMMNQIRYTMPEGESELARINKMITSLIVEK